MEKCVPTHVKEEWEKRRGVSVKRDEERSHEGLRELEGDFSKKNMRGRGVGADSESI